MQGRCGWSWSSVIATRKDWYDGKKIHVLVQLSLQKHPDLPNVPLILDLAKTPEQKQILTLVFARQALGRPFVAPPGVPQDRVAALRKAFMDTMKDPEFLAEAEKAQLEITPISGEDVQKIVVDAYKTDPAIAKKTEELLKVRNNYVDEDVAPAARLQPHPAAAAFTPRIHDRTYPSFAAQRRLITKVSPWTRKQSRTRRSRITPAGNPTSLST